MRSRHELLNTIVAEVERAYAKHGREPWSRHEFYGVLLEEVEETWEAIKADDAQDVVLAELVQVAAVCLRYAETGDRHRGDHPAPAVRHPGLPSARDLQQEVYGWLGFYRHHLPPAAINRLQEILGPLERAP